MSSAVLQPHEQTALEVYARQLRTRYGDRIQAIKIFGSAARGERWEESDIDVFVLLDTVTWREKRDIWDAATLLNIDHDTMLSPLVLSTKDYQELLDREKRLAVDIEREGQPI